MDDIRLTLWGLLQFTLDVLKEDGIDTDEILTRACDNILEKKDSKLELSTDQVVENIKNIERFLTAYPTHQALLTNSQHVSHTPIHLPQATCVDESRHLLTQALDGNTELQNLLQSLQGVIQPTQDTPSTHTASSTLTIATPRPDTGEDVLSMYHLSASVSSQFSAYVNKYSPDRKLLGVLEWLEFYHKTVHTEFDVFNLGIVCDTSISMHERIKHLRFRVFHGKYLPVALDDHKHDVISILADSAFMQMG